MEDFKVIGINIGINDSNGRPIKSGDKIRYEYMRGFNWTDDGRKIHCFPFTDSEKTFHETVMEYQTKKDCAGFFLDLPGGVSMIPYKDTIKYFVV